MSEAGIAAFELRAVDLPFRVSFKHAAAERTRSESLFLKCITDVGAAGFGESLPRRYVTGETREGVFELLVEQILPRLIGRRFESLAQVEAFLSNCDGRAPLDWVNPTIPQGAAWCTVDLALLDAFGQAFGERPLAAAPKKLPEDFRFSGVLSDETGWKRTLLVLAQRAGGLHHLKLKVGPETSTKAIRRIRALVGRRVELRADVNMGWTFEQAMEKMLSFARYGVRSYEQPLGADDLAGMARLVAETGLGVMADESFSTPESLERLIDHRACTAINARISKCGGLVATWKRCRQALKNSLLVQVGCQVGESSLLSAAHLRLCAAIEHVRFAEGCFGRFLLQEDPVRPLLQFHWGGLPPHPPPGPGLGVEINEEKLRTQTVRVWHSSG